MNRVLTILLLGAIACSLGADDGPRAPAARLLEVKGKAVLLYSDGYERPAEIYGTIYAGERVLLEKDSSVVLIFRKDGHVEQIAAEGTFRVTADGCRPKNGVKVLEMPKQSRAMIGRIGKGANGIVQGGVLVARAPATEDELPSKENEPTLRTEYVRIVPPPDSTILAPIPEFRWPATPNATEYKLRLYYLGNQVWSGGTKTARLAYDGKTPLKQGVLYSWDVTTIIDGKAFVVCEGMFRIADEQQRSDAEAMRKLIARPEAPYLAIAALWYRQNEMIEEAIAVNQRLAKVTDAQEVYSTLAELYLQVGRLKEAKAAEKKAAEMEDKAEGGRRKAEGGGRKAEEDN